jgi:hypothetical protein
MSSCDRQFPYSHLPLQTTENNFRHSVVHSNISTALCTTDSGSIRAGLVQGMSPTGCTTGRPPPSSRAGLPRRRTARLSPSTATGVSTGLAHVAAAVHEIWFDDDVVTHCHTLHPVADFRDGSGEFVPHCHPRFLGGRSGCAPARGRRWALRGTRAGRCPTCCTEQATHVSVRKCATGLARTAHGRLENRGRRSAGDPSTDKIVSHDLRAIRPTSL